MIKAADWTRYYAQCLSAESRLAALRGAHRDHVLREVLRALKIGTAAELVEALHREKESQNAD